jgi:NAD+ kinase
MPGLKNIAFIINRDKSGAPGLGRQLVALAEKEGVTVDVIDTFPIPEGFLEGKDACCVIGGDGTLLSAASEASRTGVPVFGVNRGSLGFLTTVAAEEALESFGSVLRGDYLLDRRSMLECRKPDGTPGGVALNDIVIKVEKTGRLATLRVQANERNVTEYLCDGLIFSTPTGSTAYNLSAGGPIIEPQARVIAMTPICPHTLSNRTVIFHQETEIRIHNPMESGVLDVTLDGQRHFSVNRGEELRVFISSRTFNLMQQAGYSHFSVVRTKLGWIGGREKGRLPGGD